MGAGVDEFRVEFADLILIGFRGGDLVGEIASERSRFFGPFLNGFQFSTEGRFGITGAVEVVESEGKFAFDEFGAASAGFDAGEFGAERGLGLNQFVGPGLLPGEFVLQVVGLLKGCGEFVFESRDAALRGVSWAGWRVRGGRSEIEGGCFDGWGDEGGGRPIRGGWRGGGGEISGIFAIRAQVDQGGADRIRGRSLAIFPKIAK